MKINPYTCLILLFGLAFSQGLAMADEIMFGFGADSNPISQAEVIRGNKTGKVLGFCGALVAHLQAQGYQVTTQELRQDERFHAFGEHLQGKQGVQCGPLSKTRDREKGLLTSTKFTGAFTQVFWVTSTKLLMRNSKVKTLYEDTSTIRIGVIKTLSGESPVTSSLIEQSLPNAQIVPVINRTDAIERLRYAESDPRAIDAYASDELILYDMLNNDFPSEFKNEYVIEPPLYGFSREEYALIAYNSTDLLAQLNQWLSSPSGQQALANVPDTNPSTVLRIISYFMRSDRLYGLSLLWYGLLLLIFLSTSLLAWLSWQRYKGAKPSTFVPSLTYVPTPSTPEPTPVVETIVPIVPETSAEVVDVPVNEVVTSVVEENETRSVLTEREKEVLALVVQGHSNKEVARILNVNHRTIETHRKNIYTKLGTSSPLDLVEYAKHHQLI